MTLALENVTVRYPGADETVLDVSRLDVGDRAHLCLVGGSGSGKTTLLNVVAGIVVPTTGTVTVGDTAITALSEAARDRFRARSVGYVFQTFNLLQGLTATENVALAQTFAGRGRGAAKARARELLDRVGLAHRRDARPSAMSVGEQQRVAIARAVANEPRVILADEPTANLDERNGDEVLDLLAEVATDAGSILLVVTHDSRVRARFETVRELTEIAS